MRQITVFLCTVCALLAVTLALPDSAGSPPLPGPGLSYGGIPYGSMSGNVAAFFKRQATPIGRRANFPGFSRNGVDFSPIEQWL